MGEPTRRARIRVHPRFGRRGGLPSASREISFLQKVFGPQIPLAPELMRDLLRRRLDEIDEDEARLADEADVSLREERLRVAEELEVLGGDSSVRAPEAAPEPPALWTLVGDDPVVVVSVGAHLRGRHR